MEARRWTQGEWWQDFRRLRPSQVAALTNAARGAASAADFREKLRRHVEAAAERGDGRSVWDAVSGGEALKERFRKALERVGRVTEQHGRMNTAFRTASVNLSAVAAAQIESARELAVMRKFLEAVAIRYRTEELRRHGGKTG